MKLTNNGRNWILAASALPVCPSATTRSRHFLCHATFHYTGISLIRPRSDATSRHQRRVVSIPVSHAQAQARECRRVNRRFRRTSRQPGESELSKRNPRDLTNDSYLPAIHAKREVHNWWSPGTCVLFRDDEASTQIYSAALKFIPGK